jgi:mannobiose 2-epimerase
MKDEQRVTKDTLLDPQIQSTRITGELERYKIEMEGELKDILSWWMQKTVDDDHGGFVGKIDHGNKIYPLAPKGSVLNSRILWAFSAAYNFIGDKQYFQMAARAFKFITEYFVDNEFGGVYWTVDAKGRPLDAKKQVYALAFALYGLSEYYRCAKEEAAKEQAIRVYQDILRHSYDETNGGYIEAFTRDWKEIGDVRLSAKDANEKKSMNTHLHLLEAFANLYKVWQDELLKKKITELIQIFIKHIIDPRTNHLNLFFDEKWNPMSTVISYGHDVEAAWLVQETAEAIGDDLLVKEVKEVSVKLAEAAAKGLDGDGGLWYEYDSSHQHLTRQKHSWPQAEAMIGFFNAWQITRDQKFLSQSIRSWKFVKENIRAKNLGEWYWGVNADNSPMTQEDKVGIWKCPYHNSRACMEIISRIDSLIKHE